MSRKQRKRVLVVAGTRPEAIKLAPVMEALVARPEVETRLALTGQHTDLVDQVLDVFGLEPSWDLGIMREGQSLYDVAAGCLNELRAVYEEYDPDLVLVQGDTASVFFGSLTGFFEKTRVGHVEAGLRSRDKWRPFPEEVLRRLTSVVADMHFAPTPLARENLLHEGIAADIVYVTGNTVVDALGRIAARERPVRDPVLRNVLEDGRRLVLLTAHRRESFGRPLREAFAAVRAVADTHDDIVVVYPVHPNPQVKETAEATLAGHPRIRLVPPLDYLDLIQALRASSLVITDSGGIQEEAPSFETPVLVLREVTERPEGVDAGVAELVGTDGEKIRDRASALLADTQVAERLRRVGNPYGDGSAGERIADIIVHRLTGAERQTSDWTPVA
ncbi:MAG: non-hydrolyzing UDP-N-acetylglucosamine 2-epimerase [Longimicrobiales bacterium]